MTVDYNNFAKTFASSRKNMKWAELEYFFSQIGQGRMLDIGCGSGRLIEQYSEYFGNIPEDYLGIDLSQGLLEEAKNSYPDMNFIQANMLDVVKVTEGKKFSNIFLIASFHHLDTLLQRQELLYDLYSILDSGGRVYMTNWALNSAENNEKYIKAQIPKSENEYGSFDYNIVFGENNRYYHCFTQKELQALSKKSGFKIIENRLYEGEKNFITILEK